MCDEIRVLGLTGGIGTGKSTAAQFLKGRGFAHVDADQISRGLTADGSPMLEVLDSVFGPEGEMGVAGKAILDENGSLDRKGLAAIVFTDEKKKAKLDEIMMSSIINEIDRQINEHKKSAEATGIILDAPLLFEVGLQNRCDKVMLMTADMQVRIERVCLRDNTSEEDVRNRIANQMSDDEKIPMADIVVDNSGSREELIHNLGMKIKEF